MNMRAFPWMYTKISSLRSAISGEWRESPSRTASKQPTAKLSASTSFVRPPQGTDSEQSEQLVNSMPPREKELSRELTDSPCSLSRRGQQERGPTAKLALGYCL